MSEETVMTRDEFVKKDRGEREYYQKKADLKNNIKLPITLDGCEALLEIVTAALEIPLDEVTRQVFAGHVHHMGSTTNSTTMDEIGKLLFKSLSNHATWILNQESKERVAKSEAEKKAKAEEGTKLSSVGGNEAQDAGQPSVQ